MLVRINGILEENLLDAAKHLNQEMSFSMAPKIQAELEMEKLKSKQVNPLEYPGQ